MNKNYLAIVGSASVAWGTLHADLIGYWNFDAYSETGDNPAGTPQGNHEGIYADYSGNGQDAYAADVSSGDYVPHDATGGRFGGAFYSENHGNNGALAVVLHTEAINFNKEDFSISFWEKSQFRDVASNGWAPGRGRSQFFTKAPWLPDDGNPDITTVKGFGLNLTQNHFDLLSNREGDNFGQEPLGARFTYPPGSSPDDNGVWAHWALTGEYNSDSNDYTITVYLNGIAIDWDGGAGTTITVSNDIINNDGDLTIGSFFRNNGWATQRFISWNMADGDTQTVGKAWLDDFAMWDEALSPDDLAALADGSKQPPEVGSSASEVPTLTIKLTGTILTFSWEANPGATYRILSDTGLDQDPATWDPFAAGVTSPFATLRPSDPEAFFVLEETLP